MLLDNKTYGTVIAELRKSIEKGSDLSILTGMFSIYAFYTLRKELNSIDKARLIYSRWSKDSLLTLAGTRAETPLKNKLNQSYIARVCANWFKKMFQQRL